MSMMPPRQSAQSSSRRSRSVQSRFGNDQPRSGASWNKFVDMIDPSLPLGLGKVPYRSDQVMHLEADITRLTSATGWRPAISLESGLKQTIEWYREKKTRE